MNGVTQQNGLQPTKISILGQKTIVIDHDLWLNYVAADLLEHVKSDAKAPTKFALVTDTNLHDLYVPSFLKVFKSTQARLASNDDIHVYTVPPGESSKSHNTVGAIHDWLAANKCTKDCIVIALGGGVIGDMVGYAAATYMRGVAVVQVPTTLLSMVDSSIGGKTAIDTPYGKNLVGAFWQPKRVYIDLKFLFTLPKREFINGMAEIIKTAAIWNEEEFTALEDNVQVVQQYLNRAESHVEPDERMTAIIKRMIFGSAQVKAEVVSKDEREGGLRNLLNFGHSIGHAIEGILAPQILHGECVAIGMVKEAELSRYLGFLSSEAVARLTKCIASYGLPITLNDKVLRERSGNRQCPVNDILTLMAVDKKNQGAQKRIVLLAAIGRTFEPKATAVPDKDIRVILSSAIQVHRGPSQPNTVTCTPPGSKSISNRALVLAALGSGKCRIKNLLHSDDTQVMLEALAKMNAATFSWEDEGQTLVVDGRGGDLKACRSELYLGNAGTASRFLTAIATLAKPLDSNSLILTGNSRMKERPIGPLVDSLEANGVNIDYKENRGSLPIEVTAAGGIKGGTIELEANISSQYVSAILMCAPYAKTPVTLRLVKGKPISQAYIDMTIAMMASFGVKVTKAQDEDHTYHIPTQNYVNPSEYEIESDASSATYPLAIAAITGTTCTIPNIGTKSLQGDARFAADVLRPMGCIVEQTDISTTVRGPVPGTLQPLRTVDMEPMTDAFLTACVLAAVAKPSDRGSTTRITGIANQRVKECDRIAAMRTQLAKFGIICREHDDGIEVDGEGLKLEKPSAPIFCYDDHRVAMSFSVLALSSTSPVLIEDKYCVAKTWPGWWDSLSNTFKASLEGVDLRSAHGNQVANGLGNEKSIFLIGMRGAGKTTAGKWAVPILDWPMIDLDDELEKSTGSSIPEIIRERGWDEFRKEETKLLVKVLQEKPHRHIFACGGGIVEDTKNREILISYHRKGGMVLLIARPIESIIEYLQIDKTRPAYVDDINAVWMRRKPWYLECSNFQYYGSNFALGSAEEPAAEAAERDRFSRLLRHLTGRVSALDQISRKDRSYFVSLTMPRLDEKAVRMIKTAVIGSNAVELRVDLLEDPQAKDEGAPTVEFVTKETSVLRSAVNLPLIFTIRTKSQGGRFPDSAAKDALELYTMAVRSGYEFIDLEMTWPSSLLDQVTRMKSNSKIIASHHAPRGLSWKDGSWIPHYNKALQYGDVIKLIGFAHSLQDNDELEGFRRWATKSNSTPLIALNMGPHGQLSRIRNPFMTPVSHPALPFKAAPGQLSAKEIRQGLSLIGEIAQKKFFIFGKPVSASRSPPLHNTMFRETGLPHVYGILETDNVEDIKEHIRAPDFGGASVTIPLKLDVIPLIDEVVPAAATIGAVNTLVVVKNPATSNPEQTDHRRIRGYNTDWWGIQVSLRNAAAIDPHAAQRPSSAMVVGGGGTSRAAIYGLHNMGYSHIYLVGRTRSKLQEVAEAFPDTYNISVVTSIDDLGGQSTAPVTAIGTIPADSPIDASLRLLLEHMFLMPSANSRKVLLEMAYKPRVTELMELGRGAGWVTVPGLEALTAQGVKQFELWTGIQPLFEAARDAVLGDSK